MTSSPRTQTAHDDLRPPRLPARPPARPPARLPAWLISTVIVVVLAASAAGLVVHARQEQAEVVSRLTFGAARARCGDEVGANRTRPYQALGGRSLGARSERRDPGAARGAREECARDRRDPCDRDLLGAGRDARIHRAAAPLGPDARTTDRCDPTCRHRDGVDGGADLAGRVARWVRRRSSSTPMPHCAASAIPSDPTPAPTHT